MSEGLNYNIRPALSTDCGVICNLIQELGLYENFPAKLNEKDLLEDGFGKSSLFQCFLAEIQNDIPEVRPKIVGFSLFCYVYSTWEGRVIYMDDIYVQEQYRGNGIGTALWKTVIQEGLKNGCTRMDFLVLDWNTSSIKFYENKGAINMKLSEGWNVFRFSNEAMIKIGNEESQNRGENLNYTIRAALPVDCEQIRNLIQELADYEKFPNGPKITKNDLLEDGFLKKPFYQCFVAEVKNNEEIGSKIVGYVLYFDIYMSLEGHVLYMEDIYVTEKYRCTGIGTSLLKTVVQEGLKNGCSWLDFSVLDWNVPSINFYENKGAMNLSQSHQLNMFRLNNEAMKKSVNN